MINLDNIAEPTEADLATVETVEVEDIDWESLLPAPIVTERDEDEDFDPCHDDRYDGGIPSWSAFA